MEKEHLDFYLAGVTNKQTIKIIKWREEVVSKILSKEELQKRFESAKSKQIQKGQLKLF